MLIIFNPKAGEGGRRRLLRALDVLHALAIRHEVVETRHAGHAAALARDAAAQGFGLVVAAGGDGTIAEVASGLLDSPAVLGVLPLGTANVLALELGLPLDPRRAAEVLVRRRVVAVYPGQARFADGSRRMFMQMAGAGLDAAVVAHLDLRLKRLAGRAAYVWQTLRELARYRFRPIRILLDGEATAATSVVVSKGRFYGGPFLLAPGAAPQAPGFHAALLHEAGPWPALLAGAALPLGCFPRLPGVEIRRVRRIRLEGEGILLQADGDPAGRLPAVIEDAPGPVRMVA